MNINYINTGTRNNPHYKNDITSKLIQQFLILLGHQRDSFTISEDHGLISIYLLDEVVFVTTLTEFYQILVKSKIDRVSVNNEHGVSVLHSVLLGLSGKEQNVAVLVNSLLVFRLFVIPFMKCLDTDFLIRTILECAVVVLRCTETVDRARLKQQRQISKTLLMEMIEKFRVVKQQLDECGLKFQVDEYDIMHLHEQLQTFLTCTRGFISDIERVVRDIKEENRGEIPPDTDTAKNLQLARLTNLYTTTTLVCDAMLHYMLSIVKVNYTDNIKTVTEELKERLEESEIHASYFLEFIECCRPCDVKRAALIEVDSTLKWALEKCSLKMRRVPSDGMLITMIPFAWSGHLDNLHTKMWQDRPILVTNHLLGEIDQSGTPHRVSYFCLETVNNDSEVYRIRLVYTRALYLTVRCFDGARPRVTFQNEEVLHDSDTLWKVIPVFLGDKVAQSPGNVYAAICPVVHPHTSLTVRRSRYGYSLGLTMVRPRDQVFWILSNPKADSHDSSRDDHKTSFYNIGTLRLQLDPGDKTNHTYPQ